MLTDILDLLVPDFTLYFSKPKAPAPVPVPVAPSASADAEKERQMASREALKSEAQGGMRKNIHAGAEEAYAEQAGRALLKDGKKKAAADDLLG